MAKVPLITVTIAVVQLNVKSISFYLDYEKSLKKYF
jgi:hypothetical protein